MIRNCLKIADELGKNLPAPIKYLRPRQSQEQGCFARLESIDLHPGGVEANDSPRPGKLKTYLSAIITLAIVIEGDITTQDETIETLEANLLSTLKNRVEKEGDIDYYYFDRQVVSPIEGKTAGQKWLLQYDIRVGRNTARG